MSTLNQLWQTVIEGGEGGGILYDVPGLSLFGAQPTLFFCLHAELGERGRNCPFYVPIWT